MEPRYKIAIINGNLMYRILSHLDTEWVSGGIAILVDQDSNIILRKRNMGPTVDFDCDSMDQAVKLMDRVLYSYRKEIYGLV